jgi:hypothetical protein
MKMNKFIKILIIINGLIIPGVGCFVLYKVVADAIRRPMQPESIIVGNELETAKRDSVALQGLSYDAPQNIYNSTNFLIPISVKTYEEARSYDNDGLSILDRRSKLKISHSNSDNYFNVIFLDSHYKVIGQLVNKKASIAEVFVNQGDRSIREDMDTTIQNVVYSIGFEDSNKDGKLNSMDNHDLYISDLAGSNLTKVTTNIDIVDFQFINSNSSIFIRFKDRSDLKDEYKLVKFGLYNIASATFVELEDIEKKLKEIETILIR